MAWVLDDWMDFLYMGLDLPAYINGVKCNENFTHT